MNIGYARVSMESQDLTMQLNAFKAVGIDTVFKEEASGGKWDRPELQRMLGVLNKGDVLVVWKLDRLSRSLLDLLRIVDRLGTAGIGFRSLTENIDTTTPAGRMMMQIVGSFAEFERAMIRERTNFGINRARNEGRVGGRRFKLSEQEKRDARLMVESGYTAKAAAMKYKVSLPTMYRVMASQC